MSRSKLIWLAFFAVLFAAIQLTPANAAIEWSGDIDPADPTNWALGTTSYIGKTGSGTLDVTGGSDVLAERGYIGFDPSSMGEVTVDGYGSTWTNSGGSNHDIIDNNFYIGRAGNGTLNITNGGAVSNSEGLIGDIAGSVGNVTVDGNGSTWTNYRKLNVGGFGNGTLNITHGGIVSNGDGFIGDSSGSTGKVTVNGTGSKWMNGQNLWIGNSGNGTLNIIDGGTVISSNGYRYDYIGYASGATGVVTVDGGSSKWTSSGYLHIGAFGSGTLNITDGGEVTVGRDVWVSRSSGSGKIHFNNGTLIAGGLGCAVDDLTGTGTINTNGLVSDVDLEFNATHGLHQTFDLNVNLGHITVNLNVNGAWALGAGYGGAGKMRISDGIDVKSRDGYIG